MLNVTLSSPPMRYTVQNMMIDGRQYIVLSIEIQTNTSIEQLSGTALRYEDYNFVLLTFNCHTRPFLELAYFVIFLSRRTSVLISSDHWLKPFSSFLKRIGLSGMLCYQPAANSFTIYDYTFIAHKDSRFPEILDSLKELSIAEIEILFFLSIGYSNTKISGILCRSYHTVKNHKVNIARKAGLDGCSQLPYFASQLRDAATCIAVS
jgi:DNA-binding CsgD family transcriptional regulator